METGPWFKAFSEGLVAQGIELATAGFTGRVTYPLHTVNPEHCVDILTIEALQTLHYILACNFSDISRADNLQKGTPSVVPHSCIMQSAVCNITMKYQPDTADCNVKKWHGKRSDSI